MINEEIVPQLHEHFQQQQRGAFRRLWWVQDGAPAHRRIIVRDRLQELFNHRVIALNRDPEWPPRSPDLTPCDFFLWGYLKSKVFKTPPRDIADLRGRIVAEVDSLRRQRAVIRNVFRGMRNRATGSLQEVANRFGERFPEHPVPVKSTIWKNVRKYQREGTSLNLNKGRSGRRRTARTDDNIRAVQELLDRDPNVSVRRNGLGIAPSTFNNIVRLDIQGYPYEMIRRHQLLAADLPRRLRFCQWFLDQQPRFLKQLVIGDEAAFFMNSKVNNQNVHEYAPLHNPPQFHFDINMNRQKISLWIGLCGNGTIIGPCFF